MRHVILIAILCAVGCEKPSPPEPLPAPSNDGVQLLSLGDDRRRVIRYHLTKGSHTPLELAAELDLDVGSRIQKMPVIVLKFDITVDDVLADGSAKLRMIAKASESRDRPGATVDAATLAPLRDTLAGLVYTATLAPDGTLSGGSVSGGAPSALRTQFEDMTRAIEQVTMRFPRVPIGAGASWTSKQTSQQNGLTMTTVTTTRLVAFEDDRVSFTSQSTVAAPDQKVTQQGFALEVADIGGGGNSRGTVNLATMAMQGDLTTEFRGTVTSMGTTTKMRAAMTLRMK